MSVPCFIINAHDYAKYIKELKPSRNDLDADGSGRNVLDGDMYRSRIATKLKWEVSMVRLDEATMLQLETDLYREGDYVTVTLLEARTNTRIARSYYHSTINEGVQRYAGGKTVYDGVAFNITQR